MPKQMIGGAFSKICNALPFSYTVDIAKGALIGDHKSIYPHILWIVGYIVMILGLTIVIYKKKIKQ
ncbi:MAG: hypothetical protein WCX32_03145 [Clostridia bacterium]|jgi:ABC-2 type transport system permease protein|nr:hypothetical protein [Clostridia bacterium]